MYKCKYFKIEELVDKATYAKFNEGAWMFFNPQALMSLDGTREFFGVSITVNNWDEGGQFQFRGFRPITYTGGGTYSQHRFGNAFDCDVKGLSASEVRKRILANKDNELLKFITCIEDDVNWVHLDCRNISDRIRIIKP